MRSGWLEAEHLTRVSIGEQVDQAVRPLAHVAQAAEHGHEQPLLMSDPAPLASSSSRISIRPFRHATSRLPSQP